MEKEEAYSNLMNLQSMGDKQVPGRVLDRHEHSVHSCPLTKLLLHENRTSKQLLAKIGTSIQHMEPQNLNFKIIYEYLFIE